MLAFPTPKFPSLIINTPLSNAKLGSMGVGIGGSSVQACKLIAKMLKNTNLMFMCLFV